LLRLGYTLTSPRAATWVPPSREPMAARHPRAARHPQRTCSYRLAGGNPPGESEAGARSGRRASPLQAKRLRLLLGAATRPQNDRLRAARSHPSPWRPGSRPLHGLQTRSPAPSSTGGPRRSPRTTSRQHHAVLADWHRRLGGPSYLENRTRPVRCGPSVPSARLLPDVSLPVGFPTFPASLPSRAHLGRAG